MSDLMAGLHQPGDTVLHRLPVGSKVLGLAILSLAVVLVRDGFVTTHTLVMDSSTRTVQRIRTRRPL